MSKTTQRVCNLLSVQTQNVLDTSTIWISQKFWWQTFYIVAVSINCFVFHLVLFKVLILQRLSARLGTFPEQNTKFYKHTLASSTKYVIMVKRAQTHY